MLETLKIVFPSRRELNFWYFACLTFDRKVHRKRLRKSMDFKIENQGKSWKNRFQKRCFFQPRNFIDFSWFGLRFGRVLGGSWGGFGEHFGFQNGSQKGKIHFFNKIAIFNGFWEGLGRLLGGSGEGFGGFWGGSGSLLGAFGGCRGSFLVPLFAFAALCCDLLPFFCFFVVFVIFGC